MGDLAPVLPGMSLGPGALDALAATPGAKLPVDYRWRPPQWASKGPATFTLTVPADSSALAAHDAQYNSSSTIYVFDAVMRAQDEQRVIITENPVQTGAAINDHAYALPAKLTIEILMSDSMQSYYHEQFSGDKSRSVSAFQTLRSLARDRVIVQVATRMMAYDNMMITSLESEQNHQTLGGGSFFVTFQEIIQASVQVMPAALHTSPRSNTIALTPSGFTPTAPIPDVVANQHNILSVPGLPVGAGSNVPNSGAWSSNILPGGLHLL